MNRYTIIKKSIKCAKCKEIIPIIYNKYTVCKEMSLIGADKYIRHSINSDVLIKICSKCYKCNVICCNKIHTPERGHTTYYVGCDVDTNNTVSKGRYSIYNIILKHVADKCVKIDIYDYLIELFNNYFHRDMLELIMKYYYSDDLHLWFIKNFNSDVLWYCYLCRKKYKFINIEK
jgi:hypothetical protein